MSVLPMLTYEQASRLVPRLAPRVAEREVSAKPSITSRDNNEKNFTHNELFALQKRFLDNFIAPNNALQVRRTAPD